MSKTDYEEEFKEKHPEYVRGEECLSPFFDLFVEGLETMKEWMKSCDNCKYSDGMFCRNKKRGECLYANGLRHWEWTEEDE